MMRFQTNRLLIRDIVEEDLDSLLLLYRKKENMKFISDGRTEWSKEQLKDRYEQYNTCSDSGIAVFAVGIKGPNIIIGEAGLFNSFGDSKKLELGYILDKEYWKQGFGTEICRGLIDYGFNVLSVEKLIARMYAENTGSVKLSEKCGMKRVEAGETINKKAFYEYEIVNPIFFSEVSTIEREMKKAK